jgi:hypothetical protein
MNTDSEKYRNRYALMWLIPALSLLVALATISRWLPDPLAGYHAEQAQLMNDEDEALCRKFAGTRDQVKTCITEVALLRQRDRNGGPFY